MKDTLRSLIGSALSKISTEKAWPTDLDLGAFVLEEPNKPQFGHLATNAAMVLAKKVGFKPRDLAELIIQTIGPGHELIESMEVAGPGFINFRFSNKFWVKTLEKILKSGLDYGRDLTPKGRVLVEYVSANPTGPLHVGHGRGAALGDALARILSFVGHEVGCEYYVNDAGRQMRILGNSVLVRLNQLKGQEVEIPTDFYRGDYIGHIAGELAPSLGDDFENLSNKEKVEILTDRAIGIILTGIKKDLSDFRVRHDTWFSEKSLYENHLVEKSFDFLEKHGHTYHKDGALWFKSTAFGDDKDRVLVKSDGEMTYFASDIAYHKEKFDRGYDLLIDIWGADHHGYIPRVKAAVSALGRKPDHLGVVLVQMVNLLRDGQAVNMSTRSGQFVTLEEVVSEVGADAARFIFLTRSHESTLDFDLELAKSQSRDNPVFYVQYVCARVNSLLAKAQEAKADPEAAKAPIDLSLLAANEEVEIIKTLSTFSETLTAAAKRLEPHLLTVYLSSLAKLFHQYYGAFRLVDEDHWALTRARLELAKAVKQVTVIGLDLLGVTAPEKM
ncbi:MAG: arginine--tRNA ligase [Deltaproteobacteria bacterium]|jgi:arginyl-tRNA synthetase|nr:arginine--tRNA ligase [Deltaproteobacteria bacterium]